TLEPLAIGEPAPRPANILNVDEVELFEYRTIVSAPLATRERSDQAGFHWEKIGAGSRGAPPRCPSAEAEGFGMLDGAATLELRPSPTREARGEQPEDVPLRPGHVVVRPAGSGVAHSFLAGPDGVTMLIYGTRDPRDTAYFPRSGKIFWRGLGVIGRIEALDYWDGEPIE